MRQWYRYLISFLLGALSYESFPQNCFNVIVFSKTTGFRHPSIEKGHALLAQLAEKNGFGVIRTEDPGVFQTNLMDSTDAVIFLNTSGDVLNDDQQRSFENFIHGGGGYIGIHSAADTEYEWPWYEGLVGVYFKDHPPVQTAGIVVRDPSHLSTRHLPARWTVSDEWYNFKTPLPEHLNILLTLDESSYQGGSMGDFHPLAWWHLYDGGRAYYTGVGHSDAIYDDLNFQDHLLGAIFWAAGVSEIPAPSDLQYILVGANTPLLTWTDHANNENNYVVYRDTSDQFTHADSFFLPENATFFQDSIKVASDHYYKIGAVNCLVRSGFSNTIKIPANELVVGGVDAPADNQVKVYPNPAASALIIEASFPIETACVYDPRGNKVISEFFRVKSPTQVLEIRDLSAGVYFLTLNGITRRRFVVK